MVAPSDYTYDYGIVKPKNSKVVPFGKSVGRDESKNKDGQQLTYSYTHYDYDRYVWASKSNVYTNTKTHVSDFKKQTNRVLFKRWKYDKWFVEVIIYKICFQISLLMIQNYQIFLNWGDFWPLSSSLLKVWSLILNWLLFSWRSMF